MPRANQRKEDRKFAVLRLETEERDLVRLLGAGNKEKAAGMSNRDETLRHLVSYVKKLKLPELPAPPKKSPLRVSMPNALAKELKKKVKGTSYSQQEALVLAAKLFRKDYELELEEDKEGKIIEGEKTETPAS